MLNNKWIIGGLALFALVFAYKRLVPLVLEGNSGFDAPVVFDDADYYDEADIASETGIDTAEQGLLFDSAQHDLKRFKVSDLFWNETPGRDPFVPYATLAPAVAEQVQRKIVAAGNTAKSSATWRPTVSAIVNSETHQYAVIDGEIRRVGESFNGHQLVAVARQSVTLTNLQNKQSQDVMVKP